MDRAGSRVRRLLRRDARRQVAEREDKKTGRASLKKGQLLVGKWLSGIEVKTANSPSSFSSCSSSFESDLSVRVPVVRLCGLFSDEIDSSLSQSFIFGTASFCVAAIFAFVFMHCAHTLGRTFHGTPRPPRPSRFDNSFIFFIFFYTFLCYFLCCALSRTVLHREGVCPSTCREKPLKSLCHFGAKESNPCTVFSETRES